MNVNIAVYLMVAYISGGVLTWIWRAPQDNQAVACFSCTLSLPLTTISRSLDGSWRWCCYRSVVDLLQINKNINWSHVTDTITILTCTDIAHRQIFSNTVARVWTSPCIGHRYRAASFWSAGCLNLGFYIQPAVCYLWIGAWADARRLPAKYPNCDDQGAGRAV